MRRLISILTVLVLAVTCGTTWADRCVGPMDTDGLVTQTYGVTPFNQSDIVWCDDMDSYCGNNQTNTIYWPGYPPSPDTTLCTSATDNDEWWMKTCNCMDGKNWDKDWGGPNFGVSNADYSQDGLRLEGWNGNPGWASLPYVAVQAGNQSPQGLAYYDFSDMTAGIGHKWSGSNEVNGSDTSPLVLRYWTNDNVGLSPGQSAAWGKPANYQFYMELRKAPDRSPVDYVMALDSGIVPCAAEHVNWPIICQQNPSGVPPGLPTNCPLVDPDHPRPIHNSLAFGWVAALDLNPCDVDTGRMPTMYHAATFDGQQWFRLIANQHQGNGGDFNYDMQQGFFEMTIKTSSYDVRLIAPLGCDGCPGGYNIATNTAINLHRYYTGSFDSISMGGGMGCELDSANGWACKSTSQRSVTAWTWQTANNVYLDRPVVFGGQSNKGSCCHRDTTCTPDVTPGDCLAVGDRFRSGAKCPVDGGPRCCPWPFADSDGDHDVDQADFAAFQICYGATPIPDNCRCWDRAGTADLVDTSDFAEFQKCWTGPDVPFPEVLPYPTGCTP